MNDKTNTWCLRKGQQFQFLAIPNRIGAVFYPIAKVYVPALPYYMVNRQVAVPKNKVVGMGFL